MKCTNYSSEWLFLCSLILSVFIFVPNAWSQSAERKDNAGYNVVGASITGASEVKTDQVNTESKLELQSSDTRLVEVFNWAKRQAMSFVFEDDPVGPWYEAEEPHVRLSVCVTYSISRWAPMALLEITNHEFLDKNYRKERTTFADGTTVTIDKDAKTFEIKPELK